METTRETVRLVEDAADAVNRKGESVFAAFREPGSRWYRGDRYLFAWDLQGNRKVYPPDPEHEKQNLIRLKDVGGKPIGRMFVRAAKEGDGKGWVHYQWNRPHDLQPIWKSTYIVRAHSPSGTDYLIGSGVYRGGMEKAFLVEEVEAAADLLRQQGKDAFPTLRDPTSRFFFHDTYVFVTADNGVELVNPAFPGIEGRNLWDVRDSTGKYLVREYIELAKEQGHGWVTYHWPRPTQPQADALKTTYVRSVEVGDETLIVGAGMYQ
nr:cache domain-containing protein [Guyparkeria hydrothermalis]